MNHNVLMTKLTPSDLRAEAQKLIRIRHRSWLRCFAV
jgi:hypothetical protein